MKKIIVFLMALCMVMPAAYAELSKDELKHNEKMAKNEAKKRKKQGWDNMGPLPLEESLFRMYNEMTEKGLDYEPGVSNPSRSKNNARQMCLTSALNSYSLKNEANIKGKAKNLSRDGMISEVALDQFESAFLTETTQQVRGELKEAVSMVKENPDGTYVVEIYYLVDPAAANNARARALEKTIEEQKLSNELANEIRKAYLQ